MECFLCFHLLGSWLLVCLDWTEVGMICLLLQDPTYATNLATTQGDERVCFLERVCTEGTLEILLPLFDIQKREDADRLE